jgi:hypothetical protein
MTEGLERRSLTVAVHHGFYRTVTVRERQPMPNEMTGTSYQESGRLFFMTAKNSGLAGKPSAGAQDPWSKPDYEILGKRRTQRSVNCQAQSPPTHR